MMILKIVIMLIIHIITIITVIAIMLHYDNYIITIIADCFLLEWLASVGSRVVDELDYKKPILYVVPIQSILGKLSLVFVGDTGTIPYSMRNTFAGAPGDRRLGAGHCSDGCRMWFVN